VIDRSKAGRIDGGLPIASGVSSRKVRGMTFLGIIIPDWEMNIAVTVDEFSVKWQKLFYSSIRKMSV
jgi:hypothetical protein